MLALRAIVRILGKRLTSLMVCDDEMMRGVPAPLRTSMKEWLESVK